jgi:uncharacterized protein YqjF (DUF2071 family)
MEGVASIRGTKKHGNATARIGKKVGGAERVKLEEGGWKVKISAALCGLLFVCTTIIAATFGAILLFALDSLCRLLGCSPFQFMHHGSWDDALFLHWKIELPVLSSMLSAELEPATFDGHAYIGLVLLSEADIAPSFLPVSLARLLAISHHAVNVRTYVRPVGQPDAPVGVYFFSLDASSLLASVGARSLFGLPYFPAAMERRKENSSTAGQGKGCDRWQRASFRCNRWGGQSFARAEYETMDQYSKWPDEDCGMAPSALSTFLTERYCLYKTLPGRGRTIFRGNIAHAPWTFRPVRLISIEQNAVSVASNGILAEKMLMGGGCEVHFGSVRQGGIDFRLFRAVRSSDSIRERTCCVSIVRALSRTKARQASLTTSPEDLQLEPPTPGEPGAAGARSQDRTQQRAWKKLLSLKDRESEN